MLFKAYKEEYIENNSKTLDFKHPVHKKILLQTRWINPPMENIFHKKIHHPLIRKFISLEQVLFSRHTKLQNF